MSKLDRNTIYSELPATVNTRAALSGRTPLWRKKRLSPTPTSHHTDWNRTGRPFTTGKTQPRGAARTSISMKQPMWNEEKEKGNASVLHFRRRNKPGRRKTEVLHISGNIVISQSEQDLKKDIQEEMDQIKDGLQKVARVLTGTLIKESGQVREGTQEQSDRQISSSHLARSKQEIQ